MEADLFPSGVPKKYFDTNMVNTQALECADRNDQITGDETWLAVRPFGCRKRRET
jgi:hypothetical protein